MAETRKQAGTPRRSRDVVGSTAVHRVTPPPSALSVEATAKTFYGGQRIRVGQIFTLEHQDDFNPKCMRRLGGRRELEAPAGSSATSPPDAGPTGAFDPLGDTR